jgi:hypothetical protein
MTGQSEKVRVATASPFFAIGTFIDSVKKSKLTLEQFLIRMEPAP